MNIGFDFRMGGSQHGGIGRYAFEILIHLLEHNTNDSFTVFYNPDLALEEDIKKIQSSAQVTMVPTPARHYSFAEQIFFLRLLNKHNLDIMHFPNFNIPIFYKKPFVVTIHDVVHHKISGHKKGRYYKFLAYKKVIETAAKNSTAVITVSEESKNDIVKTFEIPAEKVLVIYEATTLIPQEEKQLPIVKRKYLLERPYFIFVGTLERKKNIIGLTNGFDLFLSKYKLDMDLVFAGKIDQHYPEVKFQALDIPHKNRLVFTDYISDADLAALYQGAFAYVNASLHEGFGLPGVEAMNFGLPLAVSNLPVFNEIYDNAALYFDATNPEDIAEKLYLLAKDPQFHAQMQEKSAARAAFFDWNKAAAQTLELYRDINNKIEQPPLPIAVERKPIRE